MCVCMCVSVTHWDHQSGCKLRWLPAVITIKGAEKPACDRTGESSAECVCKDSNCHTHTKTHTKTCTHTRTRSFTPRQLKMEADKINKELTTKGNSVAEGSWKPGISNPAQLAAPAGWDSGGTYRQSGKMDAAPTV